MPRPSAPAAPRMRDARSLRDAFASTSGFRARGVATADVFTVAQEWLRNHNYVEYLRASALLSPSSDRMDADATPFDAVLRAATGAAPNLVNQDALGDWAEEFAVCHNDVEFDRRWNDLTSGNTGALAGPDRQVGGLPGHVVVTTRDAVWGKSNVGALALSGSEEEKREAVKFLLRMREAAMTYARSRGWTTLGLYFRFFGCEPVGEEERGIIRLHVVNLARAGPRLRRTAKVNLPIDDVIEALGGARASRRGAVLIVSPTLSTTSITPLRRAVEEDSHRSDDDEIDVVIKRVVAAAAAAPPIEIQIPNKLRQQYENVSSNKSKIRMAVRDASEESGFKSLDDAQDEFFRDVSWLSKYKSLSSPARVQLALSEIQLSN